MHLYTKVFEQNVIDSLQRNGNRYLRGFYTLKVVNKFYKSIEITRIVYNKSNKCLKETLQITKIGFFRNFNDFFGTQTKISNM